MKPRRENAGKPEFIEGDLQVWVCFDDRKEYDELEKDFLSILEEYKGNCPVYIFIKQENSIRIWAEVLWLMALPVSLTG